MDTIINRECAENLRDSIYHLYSTFVAARELSKQEGSGVEMIGLNPKIIPAFESVFTFLVSRNRDICRDEGVLHTGCKVGLTLGASLKYLQLPDIDVVEMRFNALLIFGALLFTLFIVEVEKNSLPLRDADEDARIEKLKEFLMGIPEHLVDSVKALAMNDIVRVTFRTDESSRGHTCH